MRSADSDGRARSFRWRSMLVLTLVMLGALGLVARAVHLQLFHHVELARAGDQLRCAS